MLRKSVIAACLLAALGAAHAATAFFTGRMEMVQTVTMQMAWNCEYSYAGRNFWHISPPGQICASSIEVY